MSGIHDAIINHVRNELERMLITEIAATDTARAGIVKLGDLQGEPDPDVARISVMLYENDPDGFISGNVTGVERTAWTDLVYDIEIGGAMSWKRRFTIKARCLFDQTKESLTEARTIASTVRTRIENACRRISFSGISVDGEYVSRPIISSEMQGEMLQAGGPPDSYDYFIKFRFDIITTTGR